MLSNCYAVSVLSSILIILYGKMELFALLSLVCNLCAVRPSLFPLTLGVTDRLCSVKRKAIIPGVAVFLMRANAFLFE